MDGFNRGFARRGRDLAEKTDQFTPKRLQELAKASDAKSILSVSIRPLPPSTTARPTLFSRCGEA